MNKEEIIHALKVVYEKMAKNHIDKGNFTTLDDIWVLKDYRDLINTLERNEWNTLGQSILNQLGGIYGKYFGKGEFVSGHCPKLISYQESLEAQNALDDIVTFIRKRLEDSKE